MIATIRKWTSTPRGAQVLLFVALVTAGAAVRVQLEELPNFAPVAALALFAGYVFHSRLAAVAVPLSVMLISDYFIGAYDWWMMAIVYGALCLPVALRGLLRSYLRVERGALRDVARPVAGLIATSLAGSVLFFLITNFGSWLLYEMYQPTAAGLLHCYVQALPFFRYTLAGDLLFATALFTAYGWAVYAARVPAVAAE